MWACGPADHLSNTASTDDTGSIEDTASTDDTALAACAALSISSVSANTYESINPPSNVRDGNLSTRWSGLGPGAYVTADLGAVNTICAVKVAWYQGASRINTFSISLSTDGKSFSTAFSGKSSGTSTALQSYSIPNLKGRYVRLTVQSNTVNNWASVTELQVAGTPITSPPPPPPPPPPQDGFHVYVAPGGAGNGLSAGSPVGSLEAARNVLASNNSSASGKNVIVNIASGTYTGQSVFWDWYPAAGRTVTIRGNASSPPLFQGCSTFGTCRDPVRPRNRSGNSASVNGHFLWVSHAYNTDSNVIVDNLRIERYKNGIYLTGDRNRIRNIRMYQIGNDWSYTGQPIDYGDGEYYGYSAIQLWRSNYNTIENCTFDTLWNDSSTLWNMHGVYIDEGSSFNTIKGSTFSRISGDTVRLRNGAHGNLVDGCKFTRTGNQYIMTDWENGSGECRSYNNRIVNSIVDGTAGCACQGPACNPDKAITFAYTEEGPNTFCLSGFNYYFSESGTQSPSSSSCSGLKPPP